MVIAAFQDDREAVSDDVILYRRIHWGMIGGRGKCLAGETARISGNCFKDAPLDTARELGFPDRCMSVGLSNVLQKLGFPPEKILEGYEDMGLAQVSAYELRNLRKGDKDRTPCPQGLMAAPTAQEPWHGIVFDLLAIPRKGGACDAIARLAHWTVPLINS